jgi:hypothetical protein
LSQKLVYSTLIRNKINSDKLDVLWWSSLFPFFLVFQGVEPERCPSFANALKAGKPVFTPTTPSIADGLTVPTVGCNAVATALPLIDKMVQVCTIIPLREY